MASIVGQFTLDAPASSSGTPSPTSARCTAPPAGPRLRDRHRRGRRRPHRHVRQRHRRPRAAGRHGPGPPPPRLHELARRRGGHSRRLGARRGRRHRQPGHVDHRRAPGRVRGADRRDDGQRARPRCSARSRPPSPRPEPRGWASWTSRCSRSGCSRVRAGSRSRPSARTTTPASSCPHTSTRARAIATTPWTSSPMRR